jgi:hypothetical protein
MDRNRFDALARLLATSGSRRATLGALLGALLGPAAADAARNRRKDRGKNSDKDKDRDRDKDRSADREREQRLQTERRKGGKRKHKKKRRGGSGGGQTPPPPACCGTDSCPDPEPGSTSSECDFAGRAFVGQDHNGSIFRGIDGRGASFAATDNQGSIFAEACLQGARFRRAKLDGSTWGGACLFGADFSGAKLDDDDPLFAEALFCGTTMPDGSVNDRDCGRETACCRRLSEPGPGPGPACQTTGDCQSGQVCVGGECICSAQTCPNGCCTGGPGQPGTCLPGTTIQACGTGGEECETCDDDDGVCQGGQCVECGDGAGDICPCTGQSWCTLADSAICFQRPPTNPGDETPACLCMVSLTGEPLCAGSFQTSRSNCTADGDCQGYAPGAVCVAAASESFPCPADGNFCAAPCCTPQSCPNGCCEGLTGCRPGNEFEFCGTGGELCFSCAPGQVCRNGQCGACDPDCICEAGRDFCASGGPNVQCQGEDGAEPCFCTITVEDNPFCYGVIQQGTPSNCTSDAECQGFAAGAACIPAALAGSECPSAGNFCAAPCCTPQSCANGCCFGGICVPGNTNEACGTGGEQCSPCLGQCTRCEDGVCQPLFENGAPCIRSNQCCSGACSNGFCAGA